MLCYLPLLLLALAGLGVSADVRHLPVLASCSDDDACYLGCCEVFGDSSERRCRHPCECSNDFYRGFCDTLCPAVGGAVSVVSSERISSKPAPVSKPPVPPPTVPKPSPPAPSSSGAGRCAGLVSEDEFYSMMGRRSVSEAFRYQHFVAACDRYPAFASGSREQGRREVAALMGMAKIETGDFNHLEQICSDSNRGACRAVLGGGSCGYGRGLLQLTGDYNYDAFSRSLYGDGRLVGNPDAVLQPFEAWASAVFFFQWRLSQPLRSSPPQFRMSAWYLCCVCILAGDTRVRADAYKDFCGKLGVDPGPDWTLYPEPGKALTSDPC
jgi:chitinase